jgi:hypothetical protein
MSNERELLKNFDGMMRVLLIAVSFVAAIFCLEIKETSSILTKF